MYKILSCFLFLILVCIGCKKNIQTPTIETKKSDINIAVKHKNYAKLNPSSKKMIEEWKEYNLVNEFMKNHENVSPEELFGNVIELQQITKELKDSLNIKPLKTPAFKSRLNVFENEVLRLSDMSEIPAITSTEANNQIEKLFLVFGSINNKINTVYSQQQFNNDVNLDDFFKLERDSIAKSKIPKIKKVSKTKKKKNTLQKTKK